MMSRTGSSYLFIHISQKIYCRSKCQPDSFTHGMGRIYENVSVDDNCVRNLRLIVDKSCVLGDN